MPRGARRPGRPAKTSIGRILDAAEELGLENLTRAGVAAHLGVSAATIRHHVESTGRLYSLTCARIFDRLDLDANDAATWHDYLLTIGLRFTDLVTAHPGLEDYVLRGPYERTTLDRFEHIMGELLRRDASLTRPAAHLLGSRILTLGAAMRTSPLQRYPDGTAPPSGPQREVAAWTLRAFLVGAEELASRGELPATTPTPDAAWTHIDRQEDAAR
ncbi:TetR/AcrR family transcriptional regulator [Nocardiopsis composta]|uniref:AcrR family transcriptional regulator n=1 Tax=Nocardiopsis composta TaxID=157465 RepID=A0A7W8QJB8_9ACTN|nr:hypothetical protein [Nocardiopsis composta]MBB5431069.1 AcrR family transcriptional regulator [Nocardiopsis composta]